MLITLSLTLSRQEAVSGQRIRLRTLPCQITGMEPAGRSRRMFHSGTRPQGITGEFLDSKRLSQLCCRITEMLLVRENCRNFMLHLLKSIRFHQTILSTIKVLSAEQTRTLRYTYSTNGLTSKTPKRSSQR